MSKEQIEFEMAEMLEIIENARKTYANDITDHTETEYIREALLDANYRKQSEGKWLFKPTVSRTPSAINYTCSLCGFESARTTPFCPECGARMK